MAAAMGAMVETVTVVAAAMVAAAMVVGTVVVVGVALMMRAMGMPEEIVRGKMNSSVNRTMKTGIGKGKRIIVVGRKSDDEKTSVAVEKKKSGNDR
jgi:hypothetical protein